MFWYASCVAHLAARPEMDDVPAAADDAELPVPGGSKTKCPEPKKISGPPAGPRAYCSSWRPTTIARRPF